MCFSLPAKVIRVIDSKSAEIIQNNKKRRIKTELIKDIKPNDWILINADMAISRISANEAKTIKKYFTENVK